jgi:hypothetical protein
MASIATWPMGSCHTDGTTVTEARIHAATTRGEGIVRATGQPPARTQDFIRPNGPWLPPRAAFPGPAGNPREWLRISVEDHVFPTVGWRSCLK